MFTLQINQHMMMQYFIDGRMQKYVFLGSLETYPLETTTSPSELAQSIMKVISPLAKCTTGMRMLAYGVAADAVEKYIKLGGTTALECLRQFCKGIIQLYK